MHYTVTLTVKHGQLRFFLSLTLQGVGSPELKILPENYLFQDISFSNFVLQSLRSLMYRNVVHGYLCTVLWLHGYLRTVLWLNFVTM